MTPSSLLLSLWLLPSFPAALVSPKLEIDATKLDGLASSIVPKLTEELGPLVDDSQLGAPTVRVFLYWKSEDAFVYGIKIGFKADSTLESARDIGECTECTTTRLIKSTIGATKRAIEEQKRFEKSEEEKAIAAALAEKEKSKALQDKSTPPAEVGDKKGSASDQDSSPSEAPKKGLTGLGKAGIGLMVAGGLAAAGGGVMLVIGQPVQKDMSLLTDYKKPGLFTLIGGGSTLIVGAILFAVDRKKAKSNQLSKIQVTPAIGFGQTGLLFSGRF